MDSNAPVASMLDVSEGISKRRGLYMPAEFLACV